MGWEEHTHTDCTRTRYYATPEYYIIGDARRRRPPRKHQWQTSGMDGMPWVILGQPYTRTYVHVRTPYVQGFQICTCGGSPYMEVHTKQNVFVWSIFNLARRPDPNPLGGSRSARGRQGQSCHTCVADEFYVQI